jgi:hypothetical protein
MAKQKRRPPRERRQILSEPQINITREANHVIECAQAYEARLVSLGPLIFFSTETGDAWVLDPADNLALCVARNGERQSFTVTETANQFAIDWQANYQIEGEQFIVFEKSGQTRTIIGYPLREIKRYLRRVMRRK